MTEVVGACSLDCPDACSWLVEVNDGQATGMRGNPRHPFTRGGLCAKVNRYLDYHHDPARVLYPLRRIRPKGLSQQGPKGLSQQGPKGAGPALASDFEQITWDEALAQIAQRFRAAIDEHGGEAIWPFPGTGSISVLQGEISSGQRLFHTLGASRQNVNICSPAGHAGMRYTTGSAMGLDPELLATSGLIVLWGTNTLTTNLHLWPFVRAGREAGAPLVVIDPMRTRTATQADLHLAPRPGTDAALALGVMAELLTLDAADEPYLAAHTVGWERFRDEVLSAWSAERAAQICGLDPAQVHEFTELIAAHPPLGIRSLMGMQRHGGGAAALRAISCLPALTGSYAQPGGGLCYSTGPAYGLNLEALNRPDLQPAGPTRELLMSQLGDELLERTDPPITVLMIWGANPVVSNPDQARVRQGLARDDLFTVVVEHTLSDTCAYADLVLPGTTQLEHPDLTTSYSHLYLQWNEPAVAPAGQARSHTDIFRALARELGIDDPLVLASDEELVADALRTDAPQLAGITPESLRAAGWQRLNQPEPYLPFEQGFATASGRFEFVSAQAERDGLGELPGYQPPADGATQATDGSLNLVSAAHHYLLNSTFAGSAWHAGRAGQPTVTLHPGDARERGIMQGARVRIRNDRGSFVATADLSDSVRPGVAASAKGLRPVPEEGGGSSVNATTSSALSDAGRGAIFHDNRVWIELA